jgi:TRAP transporter TAXI family solute receptor
VAAILVLAGAACARQAPPPAREQIRLATGMAGASFQPLGSALGQAIARRMPQTDVLIMETPGAVTNLTAIQHGEADVGLAYADVAFMAYTGQLPDAPGPFGQVRAIAVLHVSPVHVLAGANTAIRSPADLRGMRVGMGPAGSGTAVTSALLLEAFAVPLESVRQYSLGFSEAADQLAAGALDAAVVVSSDPVDSVQRALAAGARLLDIDGPAVTSLRTRYPFLKHALIPEATYPTLTRPVHTVGVDTLLLGRAGLSDATTRGIAEAFFAALPELGALPMPFRFVDPAQASATPIPLHAGASRYYRERELFR